MKNKEDRYWALALLIAAILAGSYLPHLVRHRTIDIQHRALMPVAEVEEGQVRVRANGGVFLAHLGSFVDQFQAHLYWNFLRTRSEVAGKDVYLTGSFAGGLPVYHLWLRLGDDLFRGASYLSGLNNRGYLNQQRYRIVDRRAAHDFRAQTETFERVFSFPRQPRLETISRQQLTEPLVQFLLFKSRTDRRVRLKIAPVPPLLTTPEAWTLAEDIVAVAEFLDLPLDVFLGIGAMENNYMNIAGDLEHSVWKRRPRKGDVIVRRGRDKVLVSNYACGVWQVTRETLWRIHEQLFLNSKRDYSQLPQHLRPNRKLNIETIDNDPVLTTYAGLYFRYLLDHFEGDLPRAVGAYNGGRRHPNLDYAAKVGRAAQSARAALERSEILTRNSVLNTVFLAPPRPPMEVAVAAALH